MNGPQGSAHEFLCENPRFDFPPLRPPLEYDRVPRDGWGGGRTVRIAYYLARLAYVPARSFDSSNCSKSRAHHCWPTVHRTVSRSENCAEECDEETPTARGTAPWLSRNSRLVFARVTARASFIANVTWVC